MQAMPASIRGVVRQINIWLLFVIPAELGRMSSVKLSRIVSVELTHVSRGRNVVVIADK